MKKYFSFMLIFTLLLTLTLNFSFAKDSVPTFLAKNKNINFIEDELIVSIEPDSNISIQSNINKIMNRSKQLEKRGFQIIDSVIDYDAIRITKEETDLRSLAIEKMGYVCLVKFTKKYPTINAAMDDLKRTLKNNNINVKYVEPNYKISALEYARVNMNEDIKINMNDAQKWHYGMIKAPEAWTITEGSSNIKMAILDTGIDHNHQSLKNFVNTSLGKSFVGDNTTMDVFGHGTHVAGTVASYGSVSGVMKNATLIPVKVLADDGFGSVFGIEQGILYAADFGADVINMSLGGEGYVQSMNDACETAVAKGSVVVAAAGNWGVSPVIYPAGYNSVIAVGSVDSDRTRSNFSNYGDGLDIMAPGVNIYSTVPNNGYEYWSGTSMATPHVSGVVGLMRSANPKVTVSEIRKVLNNTAQYAGPAWEYGAGIVDAFAAVDAVAPQERLITKLTTDKQQYKKGETIFVTATVTNKPGKPMQGASVVFTLTAPDGKTKTATTTTNSSGTAKCSFLLDNSIQFGTLTITANTSLAGYPPNKAVTNIEYILSTITETEPNDTFDQANNIDLHSIVSGVLDAEDTADIFKFTLQKSQNIKIVLNNLDNAEINWLLYKSTDLNNYVAYPTNIEGEEMSGTYDATSGTYYLYVYNYGRSVGNYKFIIR